MPKFGPNGEMKARRLHITPSLTKRGWRSGLPGSFGRDKQRKELDRREAVNFAAGLQATFPQRVTLMSNGAWQFLFMSDDEWYEPWVPKPEPGESCLGWGIRLGIVDEAAKHEVFSDWVAWVNDRYKECPL